MEKSPDAFRTISEVAEWLDVPTHVLRFWESRFAQVKPVKRAGGRRYYRPTDMQLIGGIKKLLHDDGMTIRGVQKLLREEGVRHVATFSQPLEHEAAAPVEVEASEIVDVAVNQAGVVSIVPELQSTPEEAAEAPTVVTFGSVREQEPELPFGGAVEAEPEAEVIEDEVFDEGPDEPGADQDELSEEAVARIAEEAVTAAVAEAIAGVEEEEIAPAPSIPPTPGVPETDAEDDDPAHTAPQSLSTRFVLRDRTVPLGPGIRIEDVVTALRQVRDRETL